MQHVHGDPWQWNGFGWTTLGTIASPVAQGYSTLTSLGDDRWALYGGLSADDALSDLHIFDGATWRRVSAPGPGISWGHAAVFDGQRVLFSGGTSEPQFLDTGARDTLWAFDGAQSSEILSQPSPGARTQHVAAYDPARQRTILHGGTRRTFYGPVFNDAEPLGDTWAFDGNGWTQLQSDAPSLIDAAATYDRRRGRVMMFGGISTSIFPVDTLYQWERDRWHELPVVGVTPPARFKHTLTPDNRRGGLLLQGGVGTEAFTDCLSDTWIMETDPELRPYARFTVKWVASGLDLQNLQSIRIDVAAEGQGTQIDPLQTPPTISGFRASAWNARARRWDAIDTFDDNTNASRPTSIVITDMPDRYLSRSGDLSIRVEPAAGWGSRPLPPTVRLTAIEATLTFERSSEDEG